MSSHWPEPGFANPPDPERGPVLIQVEYDIDPADSAVFLSMVQELGRIRRRDGAIRWGIFQDAAIVTGMWKAFSSKAGPNICASMNASPWPIAKWRNACFASTAAKTSPGRHTIWRRPEPEMVNAPPFRTLS